MVASVHHLSFKKSQMWQTESARDSATYWEQVISYFTLKPIPTGFIQPTLILQIKFITLLAAE